MPDKGGFRHYMLKEIYEQPKAVADTTAQRLSRETGEVALEGVRFTIDELRSLKKITIAASGTSRHAGLAGKYMIEQLARVLVEVDHASEFAYRNPVIGGDELCIAITQSGETADTLQALRAAKTRGARTLAICNVVASTIAREADAVLYTHAGVEISVASTKAFSAQLAVLLLLAVYLGDARGALTADQVRFYVNEILDLPEKIAAALKLDAECEKIAEQYKNSEDLIFLARGVHFPVALDGALKMKEVSYVHAEGYPTGEVKHGPTALIDETLPVVCLATCDRSDPESVLRHEKTLAILAEMKGRKGRVIAIGVEGDKQVATAATESMFIPSAPELLLPMIEIVPLQLLAYHVAVKRGCNVDQPRNLAKAVVRE